MKKVIYFIFLTKILLLCSCGGGYKITEFISGDDIYIEMLNNELDNDAPEISIQGTANFHFNFVRVENSYTHEYEYLIYLPIFTYNCFYEFTDEDLSVYIDGELLKLEMDSYSDPEQDVTENNFYVRAFYKINKENMIKISNAKDLKVKLFVILNSKYGRKGIFVNLNATEENFIRFKEFVSKYVK